MSDDLFSVRDQVVLVSGASRGIGRGLAEGFAQRGATVIITGREKETLEKTAREIAPKGGQVRAMVCDVSRPEAIDRLVDGAMKEFGRIDTLLNVAGVNRRMKAEKLTEDDYDFIVDINLKGPFLLSLSVGKQQLKLRKGNQINIVSLNNDRPLRGVMPYAVSKAGLGQMTRALAMEWGPAGIRVNAIAPGFILTDLTQKLWAQPVMKDWALANTPLRRLGVPDEMVGAAIFLASEASSFMTGQTVYVDGGVSCGNAWPIPLE
ncbi:MAG TPA: glucose 1-dehydrogenase [Planctomycetota bacterium]|nr:glucose 1-dehydrogenase [Planctomycetota bacterium]